MFEIGSRKMVMVGKSQRRDGGGLRPQVVVQALRRHDAGNHQQMRFVRRRKWPCGVVGKGARRFVVEGREVQLLCIAQMQPPAPPSVVGRVVGRTFADDDAVGALQALLRFAQASERQVVVGVGWSIVVYQND